MGLTRAGASLAVVVVVALVTGCGNGHSAPASSAPAGAAPIGTGPAYRPGSLSDAVRAGRPVDRLRCSQRSAPARLMHLELFARGRVILVPAGVGIAPPRRRAGSYVRGGRCRYPIWTDEPTGLVALAGEQLTLGDLFAVWGRPLGARRLLSFRLGVRAWVGGRRWRGDPRAIPLRRHAQVVLEAGAPLVAPHARYRFPPGR